MSTRLENITRPIASRFVKATHPNGMLTNSYAIGRNIDASNMRASISMMQSAAESAFTGDTFSNDIFALLLSESVDLSRISLYRATMPGISEDFTKYLQDTPDSYANVAEIQKDPQFNLRIQPLHKEFEDHYRARKLLKDNLRDKFSVGLLPWADAKSWHLAMKFIVDAIRVNARAEDVKTAFQHLLPAGVTMDSDLVNSIRDVRAILGEVMGHDQYGDVLENITESTGSTNDEKRDAAFVGTIDKRVTWQQLVARFNAIMPSSIMLSDLIEAPALARSHSTVVDFSIELDTVKIAPGLPLTDKAFDFVASTLELKGDNDSLAATRAFRAEAFNGAIPMLGDLKGRHLDALVAHILMYGGARLPLIDRTRQAGQAMITATCTVPLDWHVFAPYLKLFIRDMWTCFLPEPRQLKFLERIAELATRNHQTSLNVEKEVKNLALLIRSDMEEMILDISKLSATGRDLDIEEVVSRFHRNIIQYEEEVVTPFTDLSLDTLSDVDSFIANPAVVVDADRPIGAVTHPASRGRGFAEAILGEDRDAFGAITSSATMSEIADLYNKVSNFTSVNGRNIKASFNITGLFGAAFHDLRSNVMRKCGAPLDTLLCSELAPDSSFRHLGKDFFAFVVREEDRQLLLANGATAVQVKGTHMGNIHGAFSYGSMSPVGPLDLSTPFDKSVNTAITKAFDLIIQGYMPRKVVVSASTEPSINFDEQNSKYSERVAKLPSAFPFSINLDKRLLHTLAASPFVAKEVSDIISRDVILLAHNIRPRIRIEALSYIDLIAVRHVAKLRDTYAEEALKTFLALLTRPLTIDERMHLLRPEITAACKAVSAELTKSLAGKSDILRAVYVLALIQQLDIVYGTGQANPNWVSTI